MGVTKATIIAVIAFWLMVPLCMAAFARLKPRHAVLYTLFGSTMFLPELLKFDLPAIPSLDKETLPALMMMIAVFFVARADVRTAKLGRGIDILAFLALAATIGTVVTNQDVLRYGPKTIKGQTYYDAVSFALVTVLRVLIPFQLGKILFRRSMDGKDLLKALVIAILVYTPLILIELKMSPQLHNWIYGYRQHSFAQTKRGTGWRPMVFMYHGLALAMVSCTAVLAASTLYKLKERSVRWLSPGWALVWTAVILVGLNSVGALVYGIVCLPILLRWSPKGQIRFALGLAIFTLLYPCLRYTGIFPAQEIVDWVAETSPLRAESLGFRFMHEDMLLEKLSLLPLFGWGGYARGHIWNEYGRNITIIDGAWIAMMARGGIAEFTTVFCLLLAPIVMAYRALNRVPKPSQRILSGVSLIVAVSGIDLLPNGLYNGIPMFISGALAGLATGLPTENTGAIDASMIERLLKALQSLQAARALQGAARNTASGSLPP
jgi:hypothetical protein